MMRSSSPAASSNATPDCGGIWCAARGGAARSGAVDMQRAAPVRLGEPSGVLRCLGRIAEIAKHRVDVTLQRRVAAAHHGAHLDEVAVVADGLELVVRIEAERRPREPPCGARARRMQADDEECLAREAEGEPGIGGIRADALVPWMSGLPIHA